MEEQGEKGYVVKGDVEEVEEGKLRRVRVNATICCCGRKVNMSSSPTGCCAVQWAMWKGGGLTSCDRLNSSENYLLLGFLLAMPSQTVLLLAK